MHSFIHRTPGYHWKKSHCFCVINHFCNFKFLVLKSLTATQKNASGKIIILYDEDERIASQAATTMCERGFENLFMLSGGKSS